VNCTSTISVSLADVAAPTLSATPTDPSACGLADGSVLLQGQPAQSEVLEYSDNGLDFSPSLDASGLAGGSYTYFVRPIGTQDATTCTEEVTATLSDPDAPTLDYSSTDPSGCGLADGEVILMGAGTGDLEYNFENGNYSNQTIYGDLGAGGYTFSTKPVGTLDQINCTTNISVALSDPNAPTLENTQTDPSGCGIQDAEVVLIGTGGENLEYAMNDGEYGPENIFSNLASGFYNFSVRVGGTTNEADCVSSISVEITDVDAPTLLLNTTDPSGCGLNDGNIQLQGHPTALETLEYSENGVDYYSSLNPDNLIAGPYIYYVRPVGTQAPIACTSQATTTLTDPLPPTLEAEVIDPTECGLNDGQIILVASGADDFQYQLNEQISDDPEFNNLASGNFTASVWPAGTLNQEACTSSLFLELTTPEVSPGLISTSDPSNCGAQDGQINITYPDPGNYQQQLIYPDGTISAWSDQTSYTNLSGGNFVLRYRLNNSSDCLLEELVTLNAPNAPVLSLNTTLPSSCGLEDGAITAIPPSNGDYEYRLGISGEWQEEPVFTDLAGGGGYEVYIRPSGQVDGCEGLQTTSLSEGPLASTTIDIQLPSDCGANDGSIIVTAEGQAGDIYEYRAQGENQPPGEWSTSGSLNELNAIPYEIQVRMNGTDQCIVEQAVDMQTGVQPTVILVDASSPSICGGNNGSITVIAQNPGDYIYSSLESGPFQSDGVFENLAAGEIEIFVRAADSDGASCQGTNLFELDETTPPAFDATVELPPFCVQEDATVIIIPADVPGNSVEYRLQFPDGSFSNYQAGLSFENLGIGQYLIEARYNESDACILTLDLEISDESNQIAQAPNLIVEAANACLDIESSLTIEPSDEQSIYFSIDGAPWTIQQVWTDLGEGSFQIETALSETGCGAINMGSIDLVRDDNLLLQPATSSDPSSCVSANGSILVNVFGQEGADLEYTIDGGLNWDTDYFFEDLAAGEYQIGVRHSDVDECLELAPTTVVLVADDQPFISDVALTQANACTAEAASLTVLAGVDNDAELRYSLDGGETWGSSPTFSPAAGTYTVGVRTAEDEEALCAVLWPEVLVVDSVVLGGVPQLEVDQLLQPSSCESADGLMAFTIISEGDFEYSIDQGENWQSEGLFENLMPGTYSISVRDQDGGCDYFDQEMIVLSANNGPVIIDVNVSPISDCELEDAQINLNATGSPATTLFSIDGGQTWQEESSFDELAPGNYEILARDPATECVFSWNLPVQIEEIAQPQWMAYETTNPTDCGAEDGTLSVIFADPDAGELFELDGPEFILSDMGTATGLPAGYYSLVVMNAEGFCRQLLTDSLYLAPPAVVDLEDSVVEEATDCTAEDGRITLLPDRSDWAYSLDAGQSWQAGAEFSDLPGGTYEPTARAIAFPNCTSELEAIWLGGTYQPSPDLSVSWGDLDRCQENPSAQPQLIAGSPGDLYSLDGGQTWYEAEDLPVVSSDQSYSLSLSDAQNSCVLLDYLTLPALPSAMIDIQLDTLIPASCTGLANGQIWVSAIGDLEGLDFRWSDASTEAERANLLPGLYSVVVTNAVGCTDSLTVVLEGEDDNLADIAASLEDQLVCGHQEVVYDLSGEADLEVLWSGPDGFSSTNLTISITQAGTYQFELINPSGCTYLDSVEIDIVDNDEVFADFLMPVHGVVDQPIVLIDISWPRPDSTYWELPPFGWIDLGQVANQQIVQFSGTGIYEVTLIAETGDCISELQKDIEIVATPEDLDTPLEGLADEIRDFVVYPSPNFGQFKVRVILGNSGPAEVHLFDENGNLIDLQSGPELLAFELNYDLADRPSGIYPLVLRTANAYRYINVVKQ
ncbi:MAG: hypothetical protein AAGF87_10300, partial [Bacteroidota bacterium]